MLWVLIAMVLPKSLFFENVAYIELIDSPIVLEDTFVSEGGKLKWYVMLRIFRYDVLLLQHYHSLEHNCNGLSAGVVCRNTYIAVHPTYLGSGAQSDNSDRMHLDARQAIIEEEKKKVRQQLQPVSVVFRSFQYRCTPPSIAFCGASSRTFFLTLHRPLLGICRGLTYGSATSLPLIKISPSENADDTPV